MFGELSWRDIDGATFLGFAPIGGKAEASEHQIVVYSGEFLFSRGFERYSVPPGLVRRRRQKHLNGISDGFLGIFDFELGGKQFNGPLNDRFPEFKIGFRPSGLAHGNSNGQLGYAYGGGAHGTGDNLIHQPVDNRLRSRIFPGFRVHRPVETPGHLPKGHKYQGVFESQFAREPSIEGVGRTAGIPADHRDPDFLEILPGEPLDGEIEEDHGQAVPAAMARHTLFPVPLSPPCWLTGVVLPLLHALFEYCLPRLLLAIFDRCLHLPPLHPAFRRKEPSKSPHLPLLTRNLDSAFGRSKTSDFRPNFEKRF